MSQRRAVQRGPNLWISGAAQERTGPAAVPADPAHDQTIRALVQGTHGGGASQCPLEAVLGCRRRQRGGGTTVSRYGGRGDASLCLWWAISPRGRPTLGFG